MNLLLKLKNQKNLAQLAWDEFQNNNIDNVSNLLGKVESKREYILNYMEDKLLELSNTEAVFKYVRCIKFVNLQALENKIYEKGKDLLDIFMPLVENGTYTNINQITEKIINNFAEISSYKINKLLLYLKIAGEDANFNREQALDELVKTKILPSYIVACAQSSPWDGFDMKNFCEEYVCNSNDANYILSYIKDMEDANLEKPINAMLKTHDADKIYELLEYLKYLDNNSTCKISWLRQNKQKEKQNVGLFDLYFKSIQYVLINLKNSKVLIDLAVNFSQADLKAIAKVIDLNNPDFAHKLLWIFKKREVNLSKSQFETAINAVLKNPNKFVVMWQGELYFDKIDYNKFENALINLDVNTFLSFLQFELKQFANTEKFKDVDLNKYISYFKQYQHMGANASDDYPEFVKLFMRLNLNENQIADLTDFVCGNDNPKNLLNLLRYLHTISSIYVSTKAPQLEIENYKKIDKNQIFNTILGSGDVNIICQMAELYKGNEKRLKQIIDVVGKEDGVIASGCTMAAVNYAKNIAGANVLQLADFVIKNGNYWAMAKFAHSINHPISEHIKNIIKDNDYNAYIYYFDKAEYYREHPYSESD